MFTPLTDTQRTKLVGALNANVNSDRAILMNPRDTTFIGLDQPDLDGTAPEVPDEEVINAIKKVPCHY